MIYFKNNRIVEFFVIGILLGLFEDIIAIWLVTGEQITWSVVGIITLVAVPFALFSEFIADHPDFWMRWFPKKILDKIRPEKYEARMRIVEFALVGVFLGVLQDVIAVSFATSASVDARMLLIIFFVTIPFAFFSEIIVDHPKFWQKFFEKKKAVAKRVIRKRKVDM